jgi:hypothetical protein
MMPGGRVAVVVLADNPGYRPRLTTAAPRVATLMP